MFVQMPRKERVQRKNKKKNKSQSSETNLKNQGILVENIMRKERKASNCKSMAIE
jgi:hypothetical protein